MREIVAAGNSQFTRRFDFAGGKDFDIADGKEQGYFGRVHGKGIASVEKVWLEKAQTAFDWQPYDTHSISFPVCPIPMKCHTTTSLVKRYEDDLATWLFPVVDRRFCRVAPDQYGLGAFGRYHGAPIR